MCGIAGVLYADPSRPVGPEVLAEMSAGIAHRGPDGEGVWTGPGVGLVHRRLSIIDLAGGGQPIGNEDASVWVVFNGEIYNFRELRAGLEARGHRFKTRSDTEVLVHLYEEEGEGLVGRLRGMFAFALWDRKRRQLLLARDRLGIKPLYLYRDGEKLLFGSELKPILAHPGVRREVDPAALEDFLALGMVPGPRSIFAGVEKLPPAHVLVAGPGRLGEAPRCYWRLRMEPDHRRGVEDWREEVGAKVDECVRMHLVADVPVGAFLSGGIDSSLVVASATASAGGPLRTFSIGFQEEAFSELPYARQVAERFGTRHHEEVLTPDAVSLVGEMTRYYDEPYADPSAVPVYLLSRLAARHVKVVLTGDGGDEAFGGYLRYRHDLKEAQVRRWLPGWFRRALLGPLARAWPRADWLPRVLRAKSVLTNLSLDAPAAYANTLSLCRPPLRRRLLDRGVAAGLNGHDPGEAIRAGYATAPPGDPLAAMIAADVATVLPDDYLVKVDRASMAHGLEVRPPLLDHELLELGARIPSRWKVREGQTKWVLKQAARDRLPADVIGRRKMPFDLPIDDWFRGPLGEMFNSVVLGPRTVLDGLIDRSVARGVFEEHRRRGVRHGTTLWSLLTLACWAEQFLRAPERSVGARNDKSTREAINRIAACTAGAER